MEIERKFLIKNLPENLEQYDHKEIAQGYLCTSPVVRIRRSNDDYYLTYKGKGMMVREEYNLPLTKEAYLHLKEKIDGRLIEKTRYLISLTDKLTAELDVFHGDLAPLTLVEVEFESVEEANAFTAPEWFGEDVTNDGRYHNSNMLF
ncbi:MAG: CYTH domain-containing protein [Agathobacter sp.]|nr:CYTH domain-containing protein [Agathobacter sp.]